ncbi:MAG: tape measure protein [Muribaculaceae bacterium]|nr:tape measure protein [Muribaculaceae bacterium]
MRNNAVGLRIVLDGSQLKNEVKYSRQAMRRLGDEVVAESGRMSSAFSGIGRQMAGLVGAWSMKGFVNEVVNVRKEIESLEISFEVLLGSKSAATAFMGEMRDFAVKTPLQLQDIAGAAQTLLGFGIEAEKVMPLLRQLGDVSMGNAEKFKSLSLAFAQASSAGKLQGQDLMQMINAGFNPLNEIAKQTGKSIGALKEDMSKGKISADDLAGALASATAEGGQFHGMLEKQSKGMEGAISNLEGAYSDMLNEIGAKSGGVIVGAAEGLTTLVENYETVCTALMGVVASYGVYKGTLMAVTAYTNACYNLEKQQLLGVIGSKNAEIDADLAGAVSKGRMTESRAREIQALREEVRAKVEAATVADRQAQAELHYARTKYENYQKTVSLSKMRVKGAQEELASAIASGDATAIETAKTNLNTVTKEHNNVCRQSSILKRNLETATTNAATAAETRETVVTNANTAAKQTNTRVTTLLTLCTGGLTKAWQALKMAVVSNPIGAIAMAVVAVISAISMWRDRQNELNKSLEEGKGKAKEYYDALKQESATIKGLVDTIRDKTADDLEQIKAYRELMDLVPEITKQYSQQELAALDAAAAEGILTEAIRKRELTKSAADIETAKRAKASLESGTNWDELQPSERKFLQGTMGFDRDSNADSMKKGLEGFISVAKQAHDNLAELNEIADLKKMKSGEEKVSALTKEMAKLGQQDGLLKDFETKLKSWGNGIGTIVGAQARSELDKMVPQIEEAFNVDIDLNALIERTFAGGIDEEGTKQKIATFINNTFSDTKANIKANYKMLEDELDKEMGLDIEINPYVSMSQKELEKQLENNEAEINDLMRDMQAEVDEISNLESIVEMNLYVETAEGKAALEAAKNELDRKAQEAGAPRHVYSNAWLNYAVNMKFSQGTIDNQSGVPVGSLMDGSWTDWTSTTTFGGAPVQTQVQQLQAQIDNLKKQNESLRTELKKREKTTTAGGGSGGSDKTNKTNKTNRSKGGGKSKEDLAQAVVEANENLNDVQADIDQERKEATQEIETEIAQLRIDLSDEGNAKYIEQLKLNRKKELNELAKRRADAVQAEKDRQREEFEAKEKAEKAKAEKAGKKYTEKTFTDADIKQSLIDKINTQYDELERLTIEYSDKEIMQTQIESKWAYLKEYGSALEKELALTEEYAHKIAEARSQGNEWEAKRLEKERDGSIVALKNKKLVADIDWAIVFNDFGLMMEAEVKDTLAKLRAYTQTEEFKSQKLEDQQIVWDAINKFEVELGGSIKSLTEVQDAYKSYKIALDNLRTAEERRAEIQSGLDAAKKRLAEAEANGDWLSADVYRTEVEDFTRQLSDADIAVDGFKTTANNAKNEWQTATQKATATLENLSNGFQQLKSGSLAGVAEGLGSLGKAFGNNKIAEVLSIPIVEAIIGLLDVLKDGIDDLVISVFDTVLGAIDGVLSSVLSPDTYLNIAESLGKNLGNILDTITFGGLSSWFNSGESDKTLHDDVERLTASNEALQNAIEGLTDAMNDAATKDAKDIYKEQLRLLGDSEANTQEMMRRSGAAYSNGVLGIGGDKSSNHKINKGMKSTDWARVSAIVGTNVTSAKEFWTLTSEQMRKLAMEAPDLYAKIKDLADNGHENAAQYMDEYIEYAKQREELEAAYHEKLTNISFDSFRDEFKEALKDMSMSASDFADNFNEQLTDSLAEALMTDKYDPMIKDLYEKWARYMEDGKLEGWELAELQRDKDAIYESMENDRRYLNDISGGDSSSQDSSKKGFATASQESIDELTGRATGIQMGVEAIRVTNELMAVDVKTSRMELATIRQHTDEIRGLSLSAINHLADISRNTYQLYEMNERLEKIEKNTRQL